MSDTTKSTRRRTQHLLDGRRATVADLVESGLLLPGATLVFHRPRSGETHRGTVTAEGKVRLQDGQEFSSPSRAASVSLGGASAVDGWHAWRVGANGLPLDDFRQQLLDQAAEGSGAASDVISPSRRHGVLRDARKCAEEGSPKTMTVRELIAGWGAKGRGHRVNQQIEADLANHGLVTSPNFRKVTLDSSVELLGATAGDEEPEAAASTELLDESEEVDTGLTVGNLPSALGGVTSIDPGSTFEKAITLMLLNDYSQLAVLSGPRSLRGAVTWKSIARVRHASPDATFSDAIVRAHEARYDQELIDILPTLADADFVLVRDEQNAVSGIVTTADVAQAYGDMATPFFLIGEVDQLLRWTISRSFSIDDVVACCDADGARGISSFDELAFGDYQRVLEAPANWEKLGWPLDRAVFIQRLEEIREVRNDVMHFNPDPLPKDAVDKLRHFLKLLKEFVE